MHGVDLGVFSTDAGRIKSEGDVPPLIAGLRAPLGSKREGNAALLAESL